MVDTIAEIRSKTSEQLIDSLIDLKKEAFNLRFQKVSGELSNTARVRIVRKLVAKMKTVLNERKKAGDSNA